MFSKSSFNALLKTLEEPPPHVKFLLATTDPQKLPVTILSRCLQFNLKRLPMSLIIGHLQAILKSEGVEHDLVALQLLAEGADGSMRDALSLLDQALAFGAGVIRETDVREMLGSIARDKVLTILRALFRRDAPATLAALAELAELTPDYESVLAEMLSLLHHMALARKVPEALDDYVSEREALIELSEQVSSEDLQLFYQVALIGRRDLSLAPDMRSGLEMVLLRMLSFRPAAAGAVTDRPDPAVAASSPVKPAAATAAVSGQSSATLDTGVSEPVKSFSSPATVGQQDWRTILEELPVSGMVKQLAANCVLRELSEHEISLVVDSGHRQLCSAKAEKRLQQAICEYFDRDLRLVIITDGSSKAGTDTIETPAQTMAREKQERQTQAEVSIEEDGFVQAMKENFNAEIVPGSVRPVTDEIS